MSEDIQHRGATPGGVNEQRPDPRMREVDRALREQAALQEGSATGFPSDPYRARASGLDRIVSPDGLEIGKVIHSLSHFGWYKIQTASGFMPCCQLSLEGDLPLGVRHGAMIPPGCQVLLFRPRALTYGIILGVVPHVILDDSFTNPDWWTQGGQSGYQREDCHNWLIKNLYKQGGLLDFSAQRPLDGTSLEWGKIASTGIALMLTDWETYLRVNEQCGLFLSYIDSYARLSGCQLDISSLIHELMTRDDEGEALYYQGIAIYPWEALGLYSATQAFVETNSDKDVQFTKARGKIELPAGKEDVLPLHRWQEWSGYLGQGYLKALLAPPQQSGIRHMSDVKKGGNNKAQLDEGLFCESVALDGSYSLFSAKSVVIGKRVKIPIPRQLRLPEDPNGDDATANNYQFSGKTGGGPPHKVQDLDYTGNFGSLRRAADVQDWLSYQTNWKVLHPFHYHQQDYLVADESQQSANFDKALDNLTFEQLIDQPYMADPQPKKLTIDHRYNSVSYYQRMSFLALLDDGSILQADGYGGAINQSGGNIRLECPGDITIAPGRDLIVLADQIVLRARQSVDISASEHDVRLKAERNLQILGGNSGQGGVLIESKGNGSEFQFENKFGEDVQQSGIVLKANEGVAAILGQQVYVRTGGSTLGDGSIVLDAGQGEQDLLIKARNFQSFIAEEADFFIGPSGTDGTTNTVYHFDANSCLLGAEETGIGGNVVVYNQGNVVIQGALGVAGAIESASAVSSATGGLLGISNAGLSGDIAQDANQMDQDAQQQQQNAEQTHDTALKQTYYQSKQLGDEGLLKNLAFSFRDDDNQAQYGVKNLRWVERRWEQLARFGLATGGEKWTEKPVNTQGKDLYPWPGRRAWLNDPIFLRLEKLTFFDTKNGYSQDRPKPYEQATTANWETSQQMASNYKLIRPGT